MKGTQKIENALTTIEDKLDDKLEDIEYKLDHINEMLVEFKKQKQEDPDRNKVPYPETEPESKPEPDEFDSVFDEAIELKESALPDLVYLSKINKVAYRLTEKVRCLTGKYYEIVKSGFYMGVDIGNGYLLSICVPSDAPNCVETLLVKEGELIHIGECGYGNVNQFQKFKALCEEIERMKKWVSEKKTE